jgi:hypothetical protein
MKRFIKYISIALMIGLFIVVIVDCTKLSDPVNQIRLFKVFDQEVPSWVPNPSEKNPMPSIVWEFKASDKIYLALQLSKNFNEKITFTKYTFFNTDTSDELNVGLPEQLGSFEPGQVVLINYNDPWILPTKTGHYELRLYWDNRIVSKAFFDVVE